jgi:hypothetical protein
MDGSHFDGLVRSLTKSRRSLLGAALAATTGWLIANPAEAKKKRRPRRKPQKAEPNEFGCLNVGTSCKNADQCCSGICEGKKGKKTCKAHDTGSCAAGSQIGFCGGTDVACTTSFGNPGMCAATTGNARYCVASGICFACKTDADCQVADGGILGPHAACVRCAECGDAGDTACAVPDGSALP